MAVLSDISQYSPLFINALVFVSRWHQYQQRKTGEPYITHLLATAALVFEHGGTEEEAIAALAHDAVEDVGITFDQIEFRFGKEVARIVEALTEDKTLPKEERKRDYAARIAVCDRSVALVSAADKLHNLKSFPKNPEMITPDTIWFYCLLSPQYRLVLGERHLICQEMYPLIKQMINRYDAYILPGSPGSGYDRLLVFPTEIHAGMRVATSLEFVRNISTPQQRELERNNYPGVKVRLADGEFALRKLGC